MLREDVVEAKRMPELLAFLQTLDYRFPQPLHGPTAVQQVVAPISLRWRAASQIGLPRVPFEVWRRPLTQPGPQRNLPINVTVTTQSTIRWGGLPLIDLEFDAIPATNSSLTLLALDDFLAPIVGEQVSVNTSRRVRLHTPNICALRVTGNGKLSNFVVTTMEDFANDGGWELIETVGLPFHLNETPEKDYDSREQGFPWLPKSGLEAARDRLTIGLLMALSPSSLAPDGLPAPDWPRPDLDELMTLMCKNADSPLQLVHEMLAAVDPSSFEKAQIHYRHSLPTKGFGQPGTGISSEPGEAMLAVSPLVLLSAATDSWTALSLGFGTTTFSPRWNEDTNAAEPKRLLRPTFDYMVSATYHLPFGFKTNLAAIASLSRTLPVAPLAFTAQRYHRHRPFLRDASYGEDAELRWLRLPRAVTPHGYAVAVRPGGGAPEVLNEKQTSTSFTPFLPAQRTDGDLDEEALVHFIDTMRSVPFTGSRTDTYLAAALDVFGRWSDWRVTDHTLDASAPLRPQLLGAKFNLNVPAASARIIPADLQFELVWDWEDRSPQEIQLAGVFYDPTSTPPVAPPNGLQRRMGGPLFPMPSIHFSAAGIPSLSAGVGTVTELSPQPDDGEIRRYQVVLTGYTADFTSRSRLAYAIYARGLERVNPAVLSDFCPPALARVNDPLPAVVPVIPPVINWTALPDATGTARARLTFPSIPYAVGYIVYEASETALRELAGLEAPNGSLITRATEVLAIATTPAAVDAFSRVNRQPVTAPVAEVSLPSTVDGLYLYTVASVTAENIESARSAPALVAVSHRITPGAPRLQARVGAGGVHIRVEGVPGPPIAGVALFRTSSQILVSELDLMGPPIVEMDSPAWTVMDNVFTLIDTALPSWRPYYYRAVAFGPNDPSNGRLPGRSVASGVIDVMIPPSDPPDLQAIEQLVLTNGALVRIRVRSLAETRVTPLGVHGIEFLTVNTSTPIPVQTRHAASPLNLIGTLASPPVETVGIVTRGARDGDGRWLYESYVPTGDAEVIVRLMNPLGRVTEQRAVLSTTPPGPDLTGLDASAINNLLNVRVLSKAPITVPIVGAFQLDLFDITGGANTLLASAKLHNIGTTPVVGSFWRSGPDADERHTYSITLNITPGSVNRVRVRLTMTEPFGDFSELEDSV
jgi:hypothetical protein